MHPGLMAEQIEIRDWYVMYVLLVHTKIERPAMLCQTGTCCLNE
jgi:hypothetical protein